MGSQKSSRKVLYYPIALIEQTTYMENGIDWFHVKIFLDLDDEEVYHLFIWLKQVDWVVTLAD